MPGTRAYVFGFGAAELWYVTDRKVAGAPSVVRLDECRLGRPCQLLERSHLCGSALHRRTWLQVSFCLIDAVEVTCDSA